MNYLYAGTMFMLLGFGITAYSGIYALIQFFLGYGCRSSFRNIRMVPPEKAKRIDRIYLLMVSLLGLSGGLTVMLFGFAFIKSST